ncbi:MAG: hypothetical protein V2I33_23395 [Kangiellaceae bacterium]|jgi:hypothetical protein|nr:hypothetical protein [Kangiellaceae bacterium]
MQRHPSAKLSFEKFPFEDELFREESSKELPSLTNQLRAIQKPQNPTLLECSSLAMLSEDRSYIRPSTASLLKNVAGKVEMG